LNAVPIRKIYERWVSKYEGAWAETLLRIQDDAEARAEPLVPADSPAAPDRGGKPKRK
jgi:hypothetical protein